MEESCKCDSYVFLPSRVEWDDLDAIELLSCLTRDILRFVNLRMIGPSEVGSILEMDYN